MNILKRLFCKHKNSWEFYPTQVWCGNKKSQGLKITVCSRCYAVVKVTDYAR